MYGMCIMFALKDLSTPPSITGALCDFLGSVEMMEYEKLHPFALLGLPVLLL